MKRLHGSDPKLDDGRKVIHVTPRDLSLITVFTSVGDDITDADPANWVKWGGNRITFAMAANDTFKVINLRFSTDVHIKDGYIQVKNAPFGATVCVEIMDPSGTVLIEGFAKYLQLMGTGWFPMDSEDSGRVPQGFVCRITVHNSRGSAFGEEEHAAFFMNGRLEMYRDYHTVMPTEEVPIPPTQQLASSAVSPPPIVL